MTLLLSERETPEGLIVAVCDEATLGESYENGRVSLTVTEEFYGGDPADAETVLAALARAETANIVGEQAVATAVDGGFVDPENVLDLDGTVHAQYVRF
ncbi:DUF424 domain-containing protein [Haloglomus salinum]|jgi:hypothetical protein|uniref:DUF424 domain-containing protein n=1 Tax=Haloglomus salinum TaxID=2962673 RepID=UPI0020C976CA|nr:DUF424 family protein [Haloglomus salinum]